MLPMGFVRKFPAVCAFNYVLHLLRFAVYAPETKHKKQHRRTKTYPPNRFQTIGNNMYIHISVYNICMIYIYIEICMYTPFRGGFFSHRFRRHGQAPGPGGPGAGLRGAALSDGLAVLARQARRAALPCSDAVGVGVGVGFERMVCTWSLLLTLKNWLVIKIMGVMDLWTYFISGHGDSRWRDGG